MHDIPGLAHAARLYLCLGECRPLDQVCSYFPYLGTTYSLHVPPPVLTFDSIEANSVVISACIPLLLPLIKKIFGSSALGISTAKSGGVPGNSGKSKSGNGTPGLVTFGARGHGSSKRSRTLQSNFDGGTHDSDDSKYIILEERSFQYSSREAGDEDASVMERVRGTKQDGW